MSEVFSANQAVDRSYGKLPAIRTRKSSDFLDGVSRDRVSEAVTLFDSKLVYDSDDIMWHDVLNGASAAVAHQSGESAVKLTVGTVSGEYAFRQGRPVYVYISGKSYLAILGGKFAAQEANLVQRLGLFNDNDGMFFETYENSVNVVVRSSVTGSAANDKTERGSWNLDRMDGTGDPHNPSGVNVDFTRSQMFVIDYAWVGVGNVRFGVVVHGTVHYVHEHNHANVYSDVMLATPDLTPRYEIRNIGVTTQANDMLQFGSSVVSEGSYLPIGRQNSQGNGITMRSISTTPIPIFAIRQRTTFKSIANRKIARWLAIDLRTDSDLHFEVRHVSEPTSVTGAWTNFDTAASSIEYSTNISAIAGGEAHKIDSGYAQSGQGNSSGGESRQPRFINHHDLITQNYAADNSEMLVVYAQTLSGNGACGVTMTWVELK